MSDSAPFDIPSWSKAYLDGKLDAREIDELRQNLNTQTWTELKRRKYSIQCYAEIEKILAKEQNSINDVCRLLAMLLKAQQ